MSALPPIADIDQTIADVRFVPIAAICSAANISLFDDFVSAGKHRWRHGEAERFGYLEVDNHLNFR